MCQGRGRLPAKRRLTWARSRRCLAARPRMSTSSASAADSPLPHSHERSPLCLRCAWQDVETSPSDRVTSTQPTHRKCIFLTPELASPRMLSVADTKRKHRRQWRGYRTAAGGRPVKDFLARLTDEEVAAIVGGMKAVAEGGFGESRHL